MSEKSDATKQKPYQKRVIGWREWVGLPELGVSHIKAKADTGAKTSALHAFDLKPFRRRGEDWVRFNIHPAQRDETLSVPCEARVVDLRLVMTSGGHREKRYVIETKLQAGGEDWPIELTLTNRDQMGFRMLVGRSAMHRRLVVDPSKSFLLERQTRKPAKTNAGKASGRGLSRARRAGGDEEE